MHHSCSHYAPCSLHGCPLFESFLLPVFSCTDAIDCEVSVWDNVEEELKQRSTTGPVTVLVGMRSIHFKNGLKCQESWGDQEEGDGAELFLNSCFLDTVFVTLFRTAVKTAISTAVETAITTLVALHWPISSTLFFCWWLTVSLVFMGQSNGMSYATTRPPPPPFPHP